MCVFVLVALAGLTDRRAASPTGTREERVRRGQIGREVSLRQTFARVALLNATPSRPFIIDLESTNGTHVNGEQIPTSRYFELKLADGASSVEHYLFRY